MKHVKLFEDFINEDARIFVEKEFSPEKREELAGKGIALPDGSFPIETVGDLQNAVSAFGRSSMDKRTQVAKHIAARAKALGKEDMIPQTEIFQKALKG